MFSKILIIGKGSISYKHKNILEKQFKNIEIIHVGSRYFFKNLSEFTKQEYKITIIANESSAHIKTFKNIQKYSKFIFIEKPISDNYFKIKNFFRGKNINFPRLWIGYNFLFSKTFLKLKNEIRKSCYGKLISVRTTVGYNLKYWRKKNYLKSVSLKKNLGGGVLNELSHEIHYLIELFGNLQIVNKKIVNGYFTKYNVEDSAYLLFKNKKNIIISLIMDFYRNDKFRECHIIFEKATLIADFVKGKITICKKNSIKTIHNQKNDIEQTYVEQWKHVKQILNIQYKKQDNLKSSLLTLKTIHNLKK